MDRAFAELVPQDSEIRNAESVHEYPVESARMAYIHIWKFQESIRVAAKGAPETIA